MKPATDEMSPEQPLYPNPTRELAERRKQLDPGAAAAFHAFWAKGKDDKTLRFVNPEDLKLTMARLALVGAVQQVLVNGLTVLGVSAPQELS